MKRCKDCKFWQFCKHFAKESDTFGYWRLTQGALGQCDQYCCKWWKTNRFLLAVIATLLITLALLFGGCCKTVASINKEGVLTISRTRFLVTEDIGSVSYDARDGSFTIDGYKSDMTRALELVKYFAILADEEVKP